MSLRIAGMLAMTGALTGFFVGLAVPHNYEAHATLRFIRPAGLPQDMYDRESHTLADSAAARAMSAEELSAFIAGNARLREMLSADPLDDIIERLRKGAHIEFTTLAGHYNGLSVRYEDEVAGVALDMTRDLAVQVAALAKSSNVLADGKDVTEFAGFPVVVPTGATVPYTTSFGLLAGLAVGAFTWLGSRNRHP